MATYPSNVCCGVVLRGSKAHQCLGERYGLKTILNDKRAPKGLVSKFSRCGVVSLKPEIVHF